ncbi:hypothetical protein [Dyella sp. GSA-30]|uniref:hypothetical protein n=1 Tax=Dyella sp. GSA-30 TaxID=2994496 RepID=UPI00249238AA|nr:hypothetical protein [Dyella sp. GSA-30]
MRLLRGFFRLRTAGQFLSGRRDASRRSWSITVPEPLVKPVQPATPRHDHAVPQARAHMQLISSH